MENTSLVSDSDIIFPEIDALPSTPLNGQTCKISGIKYVYIENKWQQIIEVINYKHPLPKPEIDFENLSHDTLIAMQDVIVKYVPTITKDQALCAASYVHEFIMYRYGHLDFVKGGRAFFDYLMDRVANNWYGRPECQKQCDVENEIITKFAKEALEEFDNYTFVQWQDITKLSIEKNELRNKWRGCEEENKRFAETNAALIIENAELKERIKLLDGRGEFFEKLDT